MTDHEPATRYSRKYRGENLYIIVIYGPDGAITGIDMSQTVGGPLQSCTVAGIALVTELVNDLLPRVGLEYVLNLLRRCSLGKSTLPGILCEVLEVGVKTREGVSDD